jgi:hypothetical protein
MIAQLGLEVAQLPAKAEQADATPLQDGLTIPEEITRRQERKAALAQARAEIEARANSNNVQNNAATGSLNNPPSSQKPTSKTTTPARQITALAGTIQLERMSTVWRA